MSGLQSRAGAAHLATVLAEISPRLRPGETYRYRSLCYLVRVEGWKRAYRIYAYITDQRVIFIEDARAARLLGSHDLVSLVEVAEVEGKYLALTFSDDDGSATIAGLEFTPAKIREEWSLRLAAVCYVALDADLVGQPKPSKQPVSKRRTRAT